MEWCIYFFFKHTFFTVCDGRFFPQIHLRQLKIVLIVITLLILHINKRIMGRRVRAFDTARCKWSLCKQKQQHMWLVTRKLLNFQGWTKRSVSLIPNIFSECSQRICMHRSNLWRWKSIVFFVRSKWNPLMFVHVVVVHVLLTLTQDNKR